MNFNQHMTEERAVLLTKSWVEDFVIRLNLCPFAAHPFLEGKIYFKCFFDAELEKKVVEFWNQILKMEKEGAENISNSLLIFPEGLEDFEIYLLLVEMCEDLLEMQKKDAEFQIASFHPKYQFAETSEDDPRNFTNRSPFPMIHILRSEEVEDAIERYPNTLEIPEKNEAKLKEIGTEELKNKLNELH